MICTEYLFLESQWIPLNLQEATGILDDTPEASQIIGNPGIPSLPWKLLTQSPVIYLLLKPQHGKLARIMVCRVWNLGRTPV